MKERIEIIEFSMYENELLEQHLHQKAKLGWMIKEMSRFTIIYEKVIPQDVYFCVDFIDRKNPFTTHKSGKVLDYAQFLESFDCQHICGNGYRQVIRIPDATFKFHTDEEAKKQLYKKSARKDFVATLLIWAIFAICFLVGILNGNAMKASQCFGILFLIVLVAMFYVVIYPHVRKIPLSIKARKYVLMSTILFATMYIINGVLTNNSIDYLLSLMGVTAIVIGLIVLLENTKITKSINENYILKIILIIIAFTIGVVLYVGNKNPQPKPKLSCVEVVEVAYPSMV